MSTDTHVLRDIAVYKRYHDWRDHRGDPQVEIVNFATREFLADTVGSGHVRYLSHERFGLPTVTQEGRRYEPIPSEIYPIPTTGLLVQTAHACFATHQGFGMSPDTIWQTIVNQVAQHIKLNADRYASLFTWFPGRKTDIEVRDDSLLVDGNWLRALGKFEEPLRFLVGDDLVSLLVPHFSATTQLERIAALVTLMDAASPYYEYSVDSMCHIPVVRLEGTLEDWQQLYQRARTLAETFDGLGRYFEALLPVLLEISQTAGGKDPDNEFWSSIYKFKSDSGSEHVTGWLTALLAFKHSSDGPIARDDFDWRGQIKRPHTAFKTNEIPSLLSTVPFTWKCAGERIPMTFVAGALGVGAADNVYTPQLGVAVMER